MANEGRWFRRGRSTIVVELPERRYETGGRPGLDRELATNSTLRRGARGVAVKALQDRLRALGFDAGQSDGVFGGATEAAVASFQRSRGLSADGAVGPLTWSALGTQPSTSGRPPVPLASRWPTALPQRVGTGLTVPEVALTSLLPAFADWTYDLNATTYPWSLPGVSVRRAPPKTINCCIFVEALTVAAWASRHGQAFQWSTRRHDQAMIRDTSDLYSPLTAVIEARMGVAADAESPPLGWCVVQGWRELGARGHTFILLARHAPSDRVLTLEANSAYGLNGVGYRGFGDLRGLPGARPPPRWWEKREAPTWSGIRGTYREGLRLARLNVTDLSWAGRPD